MNKKSRNLLLALLVVLMISIVVVAALLAPNLAPKESSTEERLPKNVAQSRLPKLLDFGAGTCIPCKKMAPILQELSEEYKGRVIIKIIEVHEEKELTRANGIQMIPTQIFFDSQNQRVFRHQGFMDKEQIKKVFENMGVS
jgi:thioredoxin 1